MRLGLLGLLCLALSACAVERAPWFVGTWQIVGAEFAGVTAMGPEEAETWYGQTVYYQPEFMRFGSERCDTPQYSVAFLTVDDFYEVYRVGFELLAIDGPEAEIVHVGCPQYWTAPGSTLIKVDQSRAYILWDGVFFRVEKMPAD